MSELINPLMAGDLPKRGRPSKNAAVYDGGILLVKEAEREELNELFNQLQNEVEKVQKHVHNAVLKYYKIGEILTEQIFPRATQKLSVARCGELLGIPEGWISKSVKIYKFFKGSPELLENVSMKDAIIMMSDKISKEKVGQVQYALPNNQVGYDEDESFGLPTMSGITLNTYRLRAKDGKFYLLHKGFPTAIPVATLTVDQPKSPSQQMAYDNMMAQTQKAFEEYYATIEAESEDDE